MTERKPTPEAKAREIERAALEALRNEINRHPYGYKARLARRLGWDYAKLHRVLSGEHRAAFGQVVALAMVAGVPFLPVLQSIGMH